MPSDASTVFAVPSFPAIPHLADAIKVVAPALLPGDADDWTEVLSASLLKAGLVAPRCVAAFLGQCAAETGGFRRLEANLSYSAERLCAVWPHRFPNVAAAAPFADHPEALANEIYAEHLGNGAAASGDGWRFRGRGLIQVAGRDAYQRFADACGQPLDDVLAVMATRHGAADSAVWFWTVNDLIRLAQEWDIDHITRRINGAAEDAEERVRMCEAALKALGA